MTQERAGQKAEMDDACHRVQEQIANLDTLLRLRTGKRFERDELVAQRDTVRQLLEEQLAARFQIEGNKTYLMPPEGAGPDAPRVPMTADQRRDWISGQIQQDVTCASLDAQIVTLSRELADLDNSIAVGNMRFSAAKLETRAAIAAAQLMADAGT